MAYPGVVDDLRACARLETPSRVPVFALGEEFDVEMYGVDYGEYILSAEKMVECQVQAAERFDYDWILLHPDDYIEFEPLGIQTTVSERIPPAAVSNLPETAGCLLIWRPLAASSQPSATTYAWPGAWLRPSVRSRCSTASARA